MQAEQGRDMDSLNTMNTPEAYADTGVFWLCARLFGIGIQIF